MKKIIYKSAAVFAMCAPVLVFAQNKDLNYLIRLVVGYLNAFIMLLIGFAMVMFVYNVVRYFIVSDAAEKKKEAGMYVLYSVIGFFVIISFWGLVNILTRTANLDNNQPSWPFNVGVGGGGNGAPTPMGGTQNNGTNIGGTQNRSTSPF